MIPRYSKRIQKIQKDSKHFEAFRVAFEPSLIPKSFFGWRNLHLPHLWTQDETWIVRKSAQPPSQRLRAKANKRRRKGPVTTFQANTPNHAVSNFQTVERQLIKIVEKGGSAINRVKMVNHRNTPLSQLSLTKQLSVDERGQLQGLALQF